jgi:CubicO group peptidase (beta-lactamase class C family)
MITGAQPSLMASRGERYAVSRPSVYYWRAATVRTQRRKFMEVSTMSIDTRARTRMTRAVFVIAPAALLPIAATPGFTQATATRSTSAAAYYPAPGNAWQRKRPTDVGMDSAATTAAVSFALANEIKWPRDIAEQMRQTTAQEPHPEILGPLKDRSPTNGMIIRHGYIVAEWGDTERVDMTFSVAKSYLATVAGLAFDRGLIKRMEDPVGESVRDGGYASAHNAPITWHQTFNQTSEWEGTLWDKPDRADRRAGYDRELKTPGTFWEYNDVRVNRAALSTLRVWKKALPDVLRDEIMNPIGASSTWVWHGYRNSYVDIDGKRIQSVSGGGHWGGGVWASTRDHARFGYLMLRRGRWNDRQLLSEAWIAKATTPTDIRPVYGYMWWLNTDRRQFPAATARSFFALGAGGNTIWIDPENDVVVVTRWLDNTKMNEFMGLVLAAIAR